ncbi:MAG TPA: MauE/DoxX family redox-associated membrane protein [Actinomycetota bacterium]|nr:MauE/DoxX family redox-associated membrane protein [Actinomycetota bacterium]
MVETISPVVYGTRIRWAGAVAIHAAGAAATAAAFGAAVAAAGALLGAPWETAGAVAVSAIAAPYLLRELTGIRVPIPQLRRQVPDWWRTYFGRPAAAFLYGAGLGVGFLTYLGHGTLVAVTVAVAATGRPALGALAMAPFGLARGLAPLVGARIEDETEGGRLVDRLGSMSGRVRGACNAVALGAIVVAAAAAPAAPGGWGEAAAAVLAVSFAWAAISKVTDRARWRRTLAAHRLPERWEGVAAWAVPAVEASIPVLVVVGRPGAAAAVALASLVLFSVALVRLAMRDGALVDCGCFGRARVDVRVALARNLALAIAAAAAWGLAREDPALPVPGAGDLVPILLLAGATVAVAVTAWRATVWLGRGRT